MTLSDTVHERYERYLSRCLGTAVTLVRAEELPGGTRSAPLRLDVVVAGNKTSYVLRQGTKDLQREYEVCKALEPAAVPTPRVYGLDTDGTELGIPCFLADFITGESIGIPLRNGEAWAEDLYIDSVCELQALSVSDLGPVAAQLKREAAADVLEEAYAFLKPRSLGTADATYEALVATAPQFPDLRFSNGDLWLDNFIVRDHSLAAVIDFANACFSDPLYEFLLSFFISPDIRNRGIEARYCERIGCDPAMLHWYHGLEYLDTWRWVLKTGHDFEGHSPRTIEADLLRWLDLPRESVRS
jgi:aminoglycoside phosphotransferase (APT) family kinase protein